MLTIRKATERGRTSLGWLDSRHTFSFGQYHDEQHMGFGPLRVINDDRVAPGGGFPTHPHRDMEIVTYVLEGALEHKDSLGTGSVIRAGDIQRMSAGTGIRHSEHNASKRDPVRFLQLWIIPDRMDLRPGYEQKAFSEEEKRGRLRLVGSPDGRMGSITIHGGAEIHAAVLSEGESVGYEIAPEHAVWVQLARGTANVNGIAMAEGDGAAIHSGMVTLEGVDDSEVLVIDVRG